MRIAYEILIFLLMLLIAFTLLNTVVDKTTIDKMGYLIAEATGIIACSILLGFSQLCRHLSISFDREEQEQRRQAKMTRDATRRDEELKKEAESTEQKMIAVLQLDQTDLSTTPKHPVKSARRPEFHS
jgi:hypothetical protein